MRAEIKHTQLTTHYRNTMKRILTLAMLTATSSVVAEEAQKEFKLDGELGLILTTGNTDTSSLKGRLSSHHELESWSNDYVLEALYKQDEVETATGEEETQTTAQKFFISGQANYKLTDPNNRLFGFASYEDDRFSSFDFQATLAAGWNSKLWDDGETAFSYSVGPGYSFADTTEGEDVSGFIVRTAADFQWTISDTANFKQLLSSEIGSDNTKSKSETSITAKLNGAMSMKFSVILNHNSNVEEGTEKLDTETAATLVYTFF